jgi:hypothetical protein
VTARRILLLMALGTGLVLGALVIAGALEFVSVLKRIG